ncbi:MAG: FkbM family methyltransferase [Solirubrobacteraceae bacterium]
MLRRRAVGWLSRRLERPELLAAFYPGARQAWREELAIRATLAATLRSDSTYVDIGTNRGQLLAEAVRTAPAGHHIAFEPIPALAAEVTASFPQVDCRPLALGAAPGTADFCHFRKLDGWSGLRRSPQISDEQGDPEILSVRVSTLDAELAGVQPALVKIDVEGAEQAVLDGGRTVLAEVRPLIVFEHVAAAAELYDTSSASLWDLLSQLGYEILEATGGAPVTRSAFGANPRIVNWLARPKAPDGR